MHLDEPVLKKFGSSEFIPENSLNKDPSTLGLASLSIVSGIEKRYDLQSSALPNRMLVPFHNERFVPQEPANPKSLRFKVAALFTIVIVVAVIWALSVVLRPPPITIVSVEIDAVGVSPPYYYPGFSLSEKQHFNYTFQFPFTYPQRATLNSMNVNTVGFTLISMSPSLPYSLPANSTVTFTIGLIAPNRTYNGPLTLTFGVFL